ncbi:hypothetical protein [Uliginosibacterium sediminicola]|uniref:Uncharacterized protein n=1 Tax=Uliginosibacterium sediminicola TaxID=2024550 RepID=A0ABU9YXS2_9RHOO
MSIASPFFEALIGKAVSHVWRGHGSAIFVEFGTLTAHTRKDKTQGQAFGELSLMIQWSWRIERPKSILGGSWSPEARWPGMFEKLKGATVSEVQLYGQLPEICVSLSNGLRLTSFMTAEGQPEWALIALQPKIGSLCVKRGSLCVEPPNL